MRIQKQAGKIPGKRLYRILAVFPEKDLQEFARKHGVPVGKNKESLLCNLVRQRSKFRDSWFFFEVETGE